MPENRIDPLNDSPPDADIAAAHRVLEWLDQGHDGRLVRAVIELLTERTSDD